MSQSETIFSREKRSDIKADDATDEQNGRATCARKWDK
jgi:hypothetical protein